MGKQERSERLQAQKKQAACRHTGARFRARRFTTCRQHAFCLCWRSTLPAMGLRPSCSPLALPRYRLSRGPLTCLSVLVAKQWYPVQMSRRSRNQRVTNRTSSSTCRRRSPVVGVLQGACVMSGPSKKKGTTRRILTTAEPSFLDSFASRSKDVPSTTTLTWRFVTSPKRSICSHRTFPSASARGVTRTPFVGRPRVSATSISSQPRPAKTTHASGDRTKAAEASASQSSARPPWRSSPVSPGKSSTTFDTGCRTCGGRDEVATKMQRVKSVLPRTARLQRGGVVCPRRLRITTKSKSCAPWSCATAEEAYIVPLDGPGCGHSKLWPTRAMLAVPAGGAIYMLFVAHGRLRLAPAHYRPPWSLRPRSVGHCGLCATRDRNGK